VGGSDGRRLTVMVGEGALRLSRAKLSAPRRGIVKRSFLLGHRSALPATRSS